MTAPLFVDPEHVKVARAAAQFELTVLRLAGEPCGCHFADDATDLCAWHEIIGLLQPTVQAFPVPF